jgi:hypothetical protein
VILRKVHTYQTFSKERRGGSKSGNRSVVSRGGGREHQRGIGRGYGEGG